MAARLVRRGAEGDAPPHQPALAVAGAQLLQRQLEHLVDLGLLQHPGEAGLDHADELRDLYNGVLNGDPVIAYCRIGERSAHTWFVLTQLLGYPNVRNYDGSWTEWGSLVRAPIEKSV